MQSEGVYQNGAEVTNPVTDKNRQTVTSKLSNVDKSILSFIQQ